MELILKTDLETAIPAVIDWNHEQLKAELSERLKKYNSLVVTEDAISAAKKDRAALNKLRTAIDDRRKDVKTQCLRPYTAFEAQAKEIMSLIDEPISAIDKQVKAFDDAERDDKYKAIANFYNVNVGDLRDLITLDKIIPAKWANKGMTVMAVSQEIMKTFEKIRNDLGIIRAMQLDCETAMIAEYLKNFDMSAALAEKARHEELQQRLAERQAADRQKAKESAQDITPAEPGTPARKPVQEHPSAPVAPEALKTIKVIFYETTSDFRADMKALTEKHGIRYGGVK